MDINQALTMATSLVREVLGPEKPQYAIDQVLAFLKKFDELWCRDLDNEPRYQEEELLAILTSEEWQDDSKMESIHGIYRAMAMVGCDPSLIVSPLKMEDPVMRNVYVAFFHMPLGSLIQKAYFNHFQKVMTKTMNDTFESFKQTIDPQPIRQNEVGVPGKWRMAVRNDKKREVLEFILNDHPHEIRYGAGSEAIEDDLIMLKAQFDFAKIDGRDEESLRNFCALKLLVAQELEPSLANPEDIEHLVAQGPIFDFIQTFITR